MTDYLVRPGGPLRGAVQVPGDKSISHRAVMLGSLAEGDTRIEGFLEGEDCLATVSAFRAMGVEIRHTGERSLLVRGVGLHGLKPPAGALDMGNSGTSMRLMSGVLAGQAFDSELTGDASLRGRPMGRVMKPLQRMGARIEAQPGDRAPLRIFGGQALQGIDYDMPVASAQVKSCLLLAGLYASGETRVTEPAPTRDHTERMLAGFGYPLWRQGAVVSLRGGGSLGGGPVSVPGDISSAAFFLVAASIVPDSDLLLEGVGLNPTRVGVLDILRLMGARIDVLNRRELGSEPVADLRVRSSGLRGIEIPRRLVPLAIDEFPAIFVAAAYARGETRLSGAAELRVKESDRIQVMADGLQALGVVAEALPDGMLIAGGGGLGGGVVDSAGDHRIAMAFAVGAAAGRGEVLVRNCAAVATSFPGFETLSASVGVDLRQREGEA
jgi:3-phosphoshikimate 1-carboxyvinyltransferase